MNPIAESLNRELQAGGEPIYDMLSEVGKKLFFPKGILTQGAEAKEKANRMNATIGIATEASGIMHLPSVMERICDLAPENSITYAPSCGLPGLRQAWQQALMQKNPSLVGKRISLPVVSSGITHGVSVFADLWLDPDDVVLLPDKMWGNYNMIFTVRKGAGIQTYPIFTEDMRYNLEAFEAGVKQQAAARSKIVVLLNFPHNPSGYTLSRSEAERTAEILRETAAGGTNVVVALDDSYFGLFYEEETLKESMFALLAGSHPRLLAVKLDGATKENFVWGLRVGFITYGCAADGDVGSVYDVLEKKTAGCVRGSISNASHLSQSIVLASMQSDAFAAEKRKKFEIMRQRAQRVKDVLAQPHFKDAWDVYPFNSGYFMCLRLKDMDAERLRVHLLEKYGIGLISLGSSDLRVAFSCLEQDQIPELFETVYRGIQELSGTG
jgi:aspartate/methionine/tyrosine aminotransferase